MRTDRDMFITVLTFAPLAVFVALILDWQGVSLPFIGSLPLTIPNIPIPDISSSPITVSPETQRTLDHLSHSSKNVAIGVGVGLVVGVIAMGTLVDIGRGIWHAFRMVTRRGHGDPADPSPDGAQEPSPSL